MARLGKPLILPTVAGIMMIVLFFTGWRQYSKEQDGGEPEQQPVVKRRQRVKREAGVVDGGDSKSAVSLTIPPDSLRKLPSRSSYHFQERAGGPDGEERCGRQYHSGGILRQPPAAGTVL